MHYGERILKLGRRDLRWIVVETANHAARTHLHWKADRLKIRGELEIIPWGTKQVKLPRSWLNETNEDAEKAQTPQ